MTIEDLRLQAVAQFVDFDLEHDKELLEIVELAAAVTKVPFAIISFLDKDTAHFKVRKGVSETSIPRDLSFCTYAIDDDKLLMVGDASLDVRFYNNPFVTGEPRLRFFAGMPLITQTGQKIGTLCVLDVVSHILDEHQQLILKTLSHQVMKIVELRAGVKLLEEKQAELEEQKKLNNDANIRLRSFFESSTNFQVLLGRAGEIMDFNKTAVNFIRTVHKAKVSRGDQLVKYLAPDFIATFLKLYNQALLGQKGFVEGSTVYDEMGVIYWEAAFEAARDDDNKIIGVSYLIRNVTERKLKEQKILSQNASLVKIAHIQAHEFRAPLTSIMGLMSLIKEDDYSAPREYLELLEQAVEHLDTTIRNIVTNIDNSVIPQYAFDNR
jgi:PAS domain S-box-containing protein